MAAFVSAIVLAAGMSRRMGTPKQLVKVGNRTMLETTLAAVKTSNISETILVLGHEAEAIRQAIKLDPGVQTVVNSAYNEGMSTSIQAGLRTVSTEAQAAMIVLADQPLLTGEVINQLIDDYDATRAGVVLPVYKGFRGNPVLIDRSLFPEMMQIKGDIGCRSIFALHPEQIHKTPVNDIGILVDIDTSEDLARMSSTPQLTHLEVKDRSMETNERPHLVIVGKEDVGIALARLGKFLGFHVTIMDPLLEKKDFSDADFVLNELNFTSLNVKQLTFIVIASRGKYDEDALEQALNTPAIYVALVGNKKRGTELIQRLRSSGTSEELLMRVKCPAGLEIQASSAEEIALSILAEIVMTKKSLK